MGQIVAEFIFMQLRAPRAMSGSDSPRIGRQHPKTARLGQIFRHGEGDLSVLASQSKIKKSKINSPKYGTSTVRSTSTITAAPEQPHLTRIILSIGQLTDYLLLRNDRRLTDVPVLVQYLYCTRVL